MNSKTTCDHNPVFENLSREELLGRLGPGDIVHGIGPGGAVLPCLVLSIDETTIFTRRVTTQEAYRFDRKTGVAISGNGWPEGRITSVEPLPPEIHNVFVDMDRQYRLGHRSGRNMRLSESWKEALLFIHDHYARHPIGE